MLYTSGTTSDPKGVVLTHGNLRAEREGAFRVIRVDERDAILAILPLFHALAQIANLLLPLTAGTRIVFLETVNSAEMMRAFVERRITAFCVVPQFYYLLHQRISERVAASGWLARAAFRSLVAVNTWTRSWLRLNLGPLLFRQAHAAIGGRMRIMLCGGSRFDPKVGRDLFGIGFNIVQAYGLTECSGAATATRLGDPHIDTVGPPLEGVEVRIAPDPAAAPDREYQDGEVLIRGPIVMAGYHNRPDVNAVALAGGWLHTGDLGYLDRGGRLVITGRKKEIIVLASGKNIYPEEVEAHYGTSPFIKELCVLGVALPGAPSAERLHAVVVPDLEVMRERRIVNFREIIRFDLESLSLDASPPQARAQLRRLDGGPAADHDAEAETARNRAPLPGEAVRGRPRRGTGRLERRGRRVGGRPHRGQGPRRHPGGRAARRRRQARRQPRTRPRPRLDGAGGTAVETGARLRRGRPRGRRPGHSHRPAPRGRDRSPGVSRGPARPRRASTPGRGS